MTSKKLTSISEHYLVEDGLDKDSIVIDCGACVGDFTLPIYGKYKCKCFLYEPDIRNYRRVKNRLKDIKGIKIFNKAIAVNMTTTPFYLGRYMTASSLYKTHRGLSDISIDVDTITIDEILNDFDEIDILKLDIEGSELSVILNIPKETYRKIKQILVEYHLQAEIEDYTKEQVDECRQHIIDMGFEELIYDDTKVNAGQEACYIRSDI